MEQFKLIANPNSKHICNSHKLPHRPKIAKELALPTQTKIVFKKFPNASKKNKNTPTHSPTNTADNDTETQY